MAGSPQRLLGIETLRGLAAFYVFIGHAVMSMVKPEGLMAIPFKFGGEAVILFFLISGFTVTYSTAISKNKYFIEYFRKRFIRIYPIFLLSLILALIINFNDNGGNRISDLIGNIFMMQEYDQSRYGVIVNTYRNPALWSLSYEWWFYMMFWPIWAWVKPDKRYSVVIAVSCVAIFCIFI